MIAGGKLRRTRFQIASASVCGEYDDGLPLVGSWSAPVSGSVGAAKLIHSSLYVENDVIQNLIVWRDPQARRFTCSKAP